MSAMYEPYVGVLHHSMLEPCMGAVQKSYTIPMVDPVQPSLSSPPELEFTPPPIAVPAVADLVFTGRNEVLAKVIFSQASVIHSVHRGVYIFGGGIFSGGIFLGEYFFGGVFFWGGSFRGVFFLGGYIFRGGYFFGGDIFLGGRGGIFPGGFLQISGGGSPPEYGQHSAGTHPTGMHSCLLFLYVCK